MKLAFVFPGQGSQSVGMLADFAAHPVVRATFDEASDVLGQDLWALVDERPGRGAQPDGQHAAGDARGRRCGVARLARRRRRRGRSWSPATAWANTRRWSPPARSRSPTRCRWCASARRRCRRRCRPAWARWPRSSASTTPASRAACAEAAQGEVVEPVNFNAPSQVVIAGHTEAVERAIAAAQGARREARVLLPVSAPFHSSLLKPAAERLAARLAESPSRRRRSRWCTTSTSQEQPTPDGDPRRARAAGGEPGALGRDDPGVRRARRHARRRMRARQGARRPQPADRAGPRSRTR